MSRSSKTRLKSAVGIGPGVVGVVAAVTEQAPPTHPGLEEMLMARAVPLVGPHAKRVRRFLFVAGMALLTYAVAATDSDRQDEATPAPAFVLSDLAGEAVALDSFRGEPVLLNFWATWCEPCRVELPELQTLSADCVAVVGIAVNSGSADEVASFAQSRGVQYPILIADRQVLADYGVDAIPRSVLIDAEGRETAHWQGAISREQVRAAVRATLPSTQRC